MSAVVRHRRLALAFLGLVAGCATVGQLAFSEPSVALKEIHITGIGLSGGTLDLVFDVFNPNAYRLRSTRITVGLDLEGRHFGEALFERPLDLSPTNHTQVVMPVRFEWAGVGAGAKALLRKQTIGYGVTGTAFLETPIGTKQIVVKGAGSVPLSALAK